MLMFQVNSYEKSNNIEMQAGQLNISVLPTIRSKSMVCFLISLADSPCVSPGQLHVSSEASLCG